MTLHQAIECSRSGRAERAPANGREPYRVRKLSQRWMFGWTPRYATVTVGGDEFVDWREALKFEDWLPLDPKDAVTQLGEIARPESGP